MKKALLLVLSLIMVCTMMPIASAEVGGKVVIYTSIYQDVIDMLEPAIEAKFPGLDVEFFYGGTGVLQTKILGEQEVGVLGCDMMLVAEPAYSLELMEGGWLHAYKSPNREKMDFPYDEDGFWHCVRVCTMGLAYNPEMYTKEEIPTTYYDFAYDTEAAGMISMSNPLTSGTAMATIVGLVDKYGEEYFDALGKQDVMIESGSSALAKLETGECKVIMILEESVLKKREEEGSTLEWFIPEDGNVVIPSTVMSVKEEKSANKNLEACEAITDWLLSEEGQAYIVKGWMHSVLAGYPEEPFDGAKTADLKATDIGVDWEKCYKERDAIRAMFQEKVTID